MRKFSLKVYGYYYPYNRVLRKMLNDVINNRKRSTRALTEISALVKSDFASTDILTKPLKFDSHQFQKLYV